MQNKQVDYNGLSDTFKIDNDFENGLEDLLGSLDTGNKPDDNTNNLETEDINEEVEIKTEEVSTNVE